MTRTARTTSSRKELENLWRSRVEQTGAAYRLAVARLRETVTAHAPGRFTGPGCQEEVEGAFSAVTLAREDLGRALRVFTDLVFAGKLPDRR